MKKHVIAITGVSRGLGRAMAEQFIALGHVVAGCARSKTEVERLQKRFGKPHDFERLDVSNDLAVQAWAGRLLKQFGPPGFLINNAAIMTKPASLWEIGAREFSDICDVNIKGVANVIRHFAPAMIRRGRGIIVNFSSGWGRSTSPQVAPYCATKWAIEGLTKALAEELPKGVAAVPLNPGIIETDMLGICFGEAASNYPSPKEWAQNAVPYILGIRPAQNGQSLTVPGIPVD